MLLAAFVVSGTLALIAFAPLGVAVLFNIIDDAEIDKIAASMTRR
jgi:hypothetical protein